MHASGVNTSFLNTLLASGVTPVLCAITHDGRGGLLNTNADSIASAIASAFTAERDVEAYLCFDHAGVLSDVSDPASTIATLSEARYRRLRDDGVVYGGMFPKLDAAYAALHAGAARVHIMHASALEALVDGGGVGGTELVL
jgi:acetylglutamate kinase